MTSPTSTTPPKAPARLPTWRELIEQENAVREFLRARSRCPPTRPEKIITGPVVAPFDGDLARVVKLPNGSGRIEV